jgi:hypothetical protein
LRGHRYPSLPTDVESWLLPVRRNSYRECQARASRACGPWQAQGPAQGTRQRDRLENRLRLRHRLAGRRGLARHRAGRPLSQTIRKNQNVLEPILTVIGAQAPRADRGRPREGAIEDGRRLFQRGGDHGTSRAEAHHPPRRSQRPGQPQRRDPGRYPPRARTAGHRSR